MGESSSENSMGESSSVISVGERPHQKNSEQWFQGNLTSFKKYRGAVQFCTTETKQISRGIRQISNKNVKLKNMLKKIKV